MTNMNINAVEMSLSELDAVAGSGKDNGGGFFISAMGGMGIVRGAASGAYNVVNDMKGASGILADVLNNLIP